MSGWHDSDKEGRKYREYFANVTEYHISNYAGWRGAEAAETDFTLDLTAPVDDALLGRYDVVFNHTTLEHIFDVNAAFHTLCALSRDVLILVVPFRQHVHGPDQADFWRFTPYSLRELCAVEGFTPIYESAGPPDADLVYLFMMAVRDPAAWRASGITNEASLYEARLREAR